MMNIIDALRIWDEHLSNYVGGSGEFWQAQRTIGDLLAAYDALVPTPDLWPSDAQWFTVDANGGAAWHNSEPEIDFYWSEWVSMGVEAGDYHLEPDLDWRLCKWPRPEVSDD